MRINWFAAPYPVQHPAICRICGCTDERACPGGCHWMDAQHTVCSACEDRVLAIISPPKKAADVVRQLVAAETNRNVLAAAADNATGDWRRALIRKKLAALLAAKHHEET